MGVDVFVVAVGAAFVFVLTTPSTPVGIQGIKLGTYALPIETTFQLSQHRFYYLFFLQAVRLRVGLFLVYKLERVTNLCQALQ